MGKYDDGRLRPLTEAQRRTAAERPWYRRWLLASGRTAEEVDQGVTPIRRDREAKAKAK